MNTRALTFIFLCCVMWLPSSWVNADLLIYGSREPNLMEPLLEAYTETSGVAVSYIWEKAGPLLERLRAEGKDSKADVLLSADIGVLEAAREEGILRPVRSALLSNLIPAGYRDPEGHWFGLSLRARTILYAPERIAENELLNYADLASPSLRGRLCIRASGHEYNRLLTAALLTRWGPERTREWVQGLAANLARPPEGGDRDQIRALAAGLCDVAVANSYYYAMMLNGADEKDRQAAAKVKLTWPATGVHVNVSGGGVTQHSQNHEEATGFLEFLTSIDSQHLFAELNQEYPVVAGVPVSHTLISLGAFVADHRPLARIVRQRRAAEEILRNSAWK